MKKTTLATIVLLTLSLISVRADIVGFGENGAGWTLNGHDFFGTPSLPIISGNVLYITEVTNAYRARSVFFNTPQPIGNFTATFTYQNLTAVGTGGQPGNPGDGIVFAIQNQGASAVGGCCGQLGFDGITQASGVALHIYGASETGYAPATVPTNGTSQYTSTLPVDLRAAYPITVTVAYDGTTLSERLEDTITHASFSNSYTVDLQSAVNSDTALIGFTAGTGAATSDQRISDFSFSAAQTPLTIKVYPTNQFAIIAPTNFINLQAAASNSSAFQWCQESGANQVLFTDPTSSNTTVIFNYAGTYRLSVSASDGMHAASAFVDAIVEVNTNAVFQNISNFLAATIPDPTNNANIFLSFYKNGNGAADANAYYAALDALEPGNSKTNFARWKMANGFPSGPIPAATNGSVVSATYFNAQDLGLARRVIMQVTTNATTTNWAFAASHYKSLEDALADTNKEVTEAIDYSTSFPFPKFYVFSNDVSETRVPSDDLDGGGQKFVPSLCLVCHAGTSFQGGSNTHGHFLPFVLRALDYPCATGLSRGEQEPAFRAFNAAVFGVEKDIATRNSNEARPTLLNLIQGWYGVGLTNSVQDDQFVPPSWQLSSMTNVLSLAGQSLLYQSVVAPSCRTCHITKSPLIDDFGSFANFNSGAVSFLTRIWVFANKDLTQPKIMMDPASPAGSLTMPQSRRTFERFWTSIAPRPQPEILRDYLLGILTNTPPPSAASIVQVGPDVQISFTTSNGGSYRLEQADGLIPPVWTPLSGDFSGTGGTNQIFLPLDPTVLNRSYRIRSLP